MPHVRLDWLALESPAVADVKVSWLDLAASPVDPVLPSNSVQLSWLSLRPTAVSDAKVSWLALSLTVFPIVQVSYLAIEPVASTQKLGGFDDGRVKRRSKRFIVNIDGKQLSFKRQQDAIDALESASSKQPPIVDKRDRQGELDAVSAIIAKATLHAAMELRQQDEDDIELLLLSL